MANPDAKSGPHPPPNLRVSNDEAKECDNCRQFTQKNDPPDPFDGRCTGYSLLPVCDEWVCDSWVRGSEEPEQAESLSEARIRVREHFRRRRAAEEKQYT